MEVKKKKKKQPATFIHTSPCLVSHQHCHNLSAIKLAPLSLTQTVCQRNEQSGSNCYQLIMLTFRWHIGPTLLSARRGNQDEAPCVDKLHPHAHHCSLITRLLCGGLPAHICPPVTSLKFFQQLACSPSAT